MEKVMTTAELNTSIRVRKVAQVIKLFTPQERTQLLELVPELKKSETPAVLREPVARYYIDGIAALRNGEPLNLDEAFLGGLTYRAYLALSENEEDAFWEDVFAENVMDIDDYEEHDVSPNARIPSR